MNTLEFEISKLTVMTFSLNEAFVGILKNYICPDGKQRGYRYDGEDCIEALDRIQKVNSIIRYGFTKESSYSASDCGCEKALQYYLNLDDAYRKLEKTFEDFYISKQEWSRRSYGDLQVIFKCKFKKGRLKHKDMLLFEECLAHSRMFKFEFIPEDNQVKDKEPAEEKE